MQTARVRWTKISGKPLVSRFTCVSADESIIYDGYQTFILGSRSRSGEATAVDELVDLFRTIFCSRIALRVMWDRMGLVTNLTIY